MIQTDTNNRHTWRSPLEGRSFFILSKLFISKLDWQLPSNVQQLAFHTYISNLCGCYCVILNYNGSFIIYICGSSTNQVKIILLSLFDSENYVQNVITTGNFYLEIYIDLRLTNIFLAVFDFCKNLKNYPTTFLTPTTQKIYS